ncbi:MAG TPA: tetratricopeptide repeat protein [Gemmataceae bacterium]|nr:tetratricopeptide repeat protein [Gemmataceae bacterium]
MAWSVRFFVIFAIVLSPILASCSREKTPGPGPKDETDKLIAEYTEAIWLEPKDANGYYKRGVRYEELGESDKAIADFTEAIELKEQRAYVNRAASYKKKKDYDKAIADYTMTIAFYDKHGSDLSDALLRAGASAGAYFDRGICYEEKGDAEKAQADFKKAVELHAPFKEKVKNRTKK